MHYLSEIYRYRYFWVHLALSDLRARFRRSYFGVLWVILQPLLLTLIIATILKYAFHQDMASYSIYIFSGLLAWEFISGCVNAGAMCFLSAEGYVKQVRLPMAIYPLKAALYCLIIFCTAFLGFAAYTFIVQPEVISWYWLYILPFLILLFIFGLPLAIISAVINVKFRDFQQFIGLILQIVWYTSPIFLPREIFNQPLLRDFTAINPIAALMDLLRRPLLDAMAPTISGYALVLVWTIGLWIIAGFMLKNNERRIVFYY